METKIYFAGSIRGGRNDAALYAQIIAHLKRYGTVLTEHVGIKDVEKSEVELSDKFIHDRDMDWLLRSDAIVAEVTTVSMGVGYEIGRAIENHKPVLCLFRKEEADKQLSAMIGGCDNVLNRGYTTLQEAIEHIDAVIKEL